MNILYKFWAFVDQFWASVDQFWASVDQFWASVDQFWAFVDQFCVYIGGRPCNPRATAATARREQYFQVVQPQDTHMHRDQISRSGIKSLTLTNFGQLSKTANNITKKQITQKLNTLQEFVETNIIKYKINEFNY